MIEAANGDKMEVWGDGKQTRSFLYVEECVDAIRRMMEGDFPGPLNVGSEEMVSINQLAELIMDVAGKKIAIQHVPGPLGVRGRNSDNRLIREKLKWEPTMPLREGIESTYRWIAEQVATSEPL